MTYNNRCTKEKFIEYRELKRKGYSHDRLIEHFGEDIYYSDLYNKNGTSLPNILKFGNFLNEIKINPQKKNYNFVKQPSNFIENKSDYILSFYSNDIPYIIALVYFPINNINTYNIIFTTRNKWNEYKLRNFMKSNSLIEKIIGKETNLNDLFPIFRKLSWILFDFYNKEIEGELLSIGDTKNKKKIKLYRNIINDSFNNIEESRMLLKNNIYYVYKIINK